MRRREFIALLGGAAAWPFAAYGQQAQLPVIGYLSSISAEPNFLAGFRRGLSEQGYFEGRNVSIEYRYAEGRYDQLPGLARELVSRRVNVIAAVGSSPSALAAKSVTASIPIVFYLGADAVELGLVASYNRPGGNVTGVSGIDTSLTPKRLELLDGLTEKAAPLALLVNPTNRLAGAESRIAAGAAQALGRDLVVLEAGTEQEIDAAFEAMVRKKARGLAVWQEAFFVSRRHQIVALAQQHRLPAIGPMRVFTEAGCFMSYGANTSESYRQAGVYVGMILKGAAPSDLPVLQPTIYEFIINLKTAKALGLEVPPTLLALANEVIE
jgi:putative ABC transport system substrate-binding protein